MAGTSYPTADALEIGQIGGAGSPRGREDGILIRPAVALPLEIYTPRRRAEFLLGNATDREDYLRACEEVRALGLSPEEIEHEGPPE